MTADSRPPVQQPLTLILTMKSPDDFQKLSTLLEEQQSNPDSDLRTALDELETVHFARFVFLENNTKLAVITTYDGDLDTYLNLFVQRIGSLFDAILHHVSPAPPTPVQEFPQEFIDFIKRHDVKPTGVFYSAYPSLTVKHIKALSDRSRT